MNTSNQENELTFGGKVKKKIILKPAHEIIGDLVLTTKEYQRYTDLYNERVKKKFDKAS